MRLEHAVPEQLEKARQANTPLIIPVGVIEYHSSHLPMGTDALVAYEFAKRLACETQLILAPPIWYGPASYAVAGPEKFTIDMDGRVFYDMMQQIFIGLLRAGWRRVYVLIAHQTEDFNPTETACLHAARTALFKHLEKTRGIGWWGNEASQTFYETLGAADNPWNWIKIYPLNLRRKEFTGDHAGRIETSMMMALCPELVRQGKIGQAAEDWFAKTAVEASAEIGEVRIRALLDLWLAKLQQT